MKKNKFIFLICLCVGCVVISNLSEKQVDSETAFSVEEQIITSLNLDYETTENGYYIQNGDTISNIQYDKYGNVASVSASTESEGKLIETDMLYDDNQNLSNIITNNQKLSFGRDDNGYLTVEQNSKLMFTNKVEDNQITRL